MPAAPSPQENVFRWSAETMERPENNIPNLRYSRRALLGAALGMPFVGAVRAQAYPSRNLRVIVPFAAGGPTDVLTRIAAERVSPGLGQPLIVESRTGAGGNLAGELAVRSEADGYTL